MNKASEAVLALLVATFVRVSIHDADGVPINGSIGFSGTAVGTQSGGTSTLTFNNPMSVTSSTGDYSGVALGTPANWAPINWSGSGPGAILVPGPQVEWQFTANGTSFRFTLASLQSATMSSGAVNLHATGILTMTGAINRDPTNGTFNVQGTGNNFVFTIGQAVPETGSAVALLGLAVVGLEMLRRSCARRAHCRGSC
jgi:hypothetical protein